MCPFSNKGLQNILLLASFRAVSKNIYANIEESRMMTKGFTHFRNMYFKVSI